MKINIVARTKLGVYSCPSLRIAENQEQGKDKRRIFCPGLLKTNSFFLFFSIFLFFHFFLFLFFWIFPFLFFWIFFLFFLIFFIFYFFGFLIFHLDLLSIASQTHFHLFIWTYSLLPVKLIFWTYFLSPVKLIFIFSIWTYSLLPVIFIFYLGLPLTASLFRFHIWAYL